MAELIDGVLKIAQVTHQFLGFAAPVHKRKRYSARNKGQPQRAAHHRQQAGTRRTQPRKGASCNACCGRCPVRCHNCSVHHRRCLAISQGRGRAHGIASLDLGRGCQCSGREGPLGDFDLFYRRNFSQSQFRQTRNRGAAALFRDLRKQSLLLQIALSNQRRLYRLNICQFGGLPYSIGGELALRCHNLKISPGNHGLGIDLLGLGGPQILLCRSCAGRKRCLIRLGGVQRRSALLCIPTGNPGKGDKQPCS